MNLIAQDASPIFQAQNRLLPVDRAVRIGEECQNSWIDSDQDDGK
jgi:hypothetical protein